MGCRSVPSHNLRGTFMDAKKLMALASAKMLRFLLTGLVFVSCAMILASIFGSLGLIDEKRSLLIPGMMSLLVSLACLYSMGKTRLRSGYLYGAALLSSVPLMGVIAGEFVANSIMIIGMASLIIEFVFVDSCDARRVVNQCRSQVEAE